MLVKFWLDRFSTQAYPTQRHLRHNMSLLFPFSCPTLPLPQCFPSKDYTPPIPPSCHPQLNFLPPGDRFSRKDSHTEREENKHITLTHLQGATILDLHRSTMQHCNAELPYLFYLLSHFVTPLKTKQPLLSTTSSQKRQLLRLKSLPALPSAWLICASLQLI